MASVTKAPKPARTTKQTTSMCSWAVSQMRTHGDGQTHAGTPMQIMYQGRCCRQSRPPYTEGPTSRQSLDADSQRQSSPVLRQAAATDSAFHLKRKPAWSLEGCECAEPSVVVVLWPRDTTATAIVPARFDHPIPTSISGQALKQKLMSVLHARCGKERLQHAQVEPNRANSKRHEATVKEQDLQDQARGSSESQPSSGEISTTRPNGLGSKQCQHRFWIWAGPDWCSRLSYLMRASQIHLQCAGSTLPAPNGLGGRRYSQLQEEERQHLYDLT